MTKMFSGLVVSTKMAKTITVKVVSQRVHPLYKKIMKRTKKYKVHNLNDQVKIGDTVEFSETKPISGDKKFRFVKLVKSLK